MANKALPESLTSPGTITAEQAETLIQLLDIQCRITAVTSMANLGIETLTKNDKHVTAVFAGAEKTLMLQVNRLNDIRQTREGK